MKKISEFKYVVYEDGGSFVAQCLNIDISSYGATADSAVSKLKEAVCESLSDSHQEYRPIGIAMAGTDLLYETLK